MADQIKNSAPRRPGVPTHRPWRWLLRTWRGRVLLLLALALLAGGSQAVWQWRHSPIVEMVELGRTSWDDAYALVTPDGQHVLAVLGTKAVGGGDLWVDGQVIAGQTGRQVVAASLTADGHWFEVTVDSFELMQRWNRAEMAELPPLPDHQPVGTQWLTTGPYGKPMAFDAQVLLDGQAPAIPYQTLTAATLPDDVLLATYADGTVCLLDHGTPGPPLTAILAGSIVRSPAGQQLACLAWQGEDLVVVRDGQVVLTLPYRSGAAHGLVESLSAEQGAYDLRFSRNNRQLYVLCDPPATAPQAGIMTLYREAQVLAQFPSICDLVESSDGSHLAFAAYAQPHLSFTPKHDQSWGPAQVWHDGQLTAAPDYGHDLQFLGTSGRLAYISGLDDWLPATQRALIVDGQQVPKSQGCYDLQCTPAGDHLAWQRSVAGDRKMLVADGHPVALGSSLGLCALAGTTPHWACFPREDNGTRLRWDGGEWLITDGRADLEDAAATFSPDGRHVFWQTVTTAAPSQLSRWLYEWCYPHLPTEYLRDLAERHWQTAMQAQLYRDGQLIATSGRGPMESIAEDPFRYVLTRACLGFAFAPSGRHWACFQLVYEGPQRLLYDGVPGPAFEHVWQARQDGASGLGCVRFAADDAVTYLAFRQQTFYRVTHRPRP